MGKRKLIASLETSSHQHQSKLTPSTQASFSTSQEWKQIERTKCQVHQTLSLRLRLMLPQLHKTHRLLDQTGLMPSCDKCALANTINSDPKHFFAPLYNNFLQK